MVKWIRVSSVRDPNVTGAVSERFIATLKDTDYPWLFAMKATNGNVEMFFGADESDFFLITSALSLYRGVKTEAVDSPVEWNNFNSFFAIKQKNHFAYPLFLMNEKTWLQMDPLGIFANAFAEFSKNNEIALLFLNKGVDERSERKYKKVIYKTIVEKKRKIGAAGIVYDPSRTNTNLRLGYNKGDVQTEDLIERKRNSILFESTIILASSDSNVSRNVNGIFNIFGSSLNSLFARKIKKELALEVIKKLGALSFMQRLFFNPINILSSDELATIIHIPTSQSFISSGVERTNFKQLEIPSNLPDSGEKIGVAVSGSNEKEVYLTKEMLMKNIFAVGNAGFGKSNLAITTFIKSLNVDKNGTYIFYDPHGDAANKILSLIPEDRIEDTIYLNAADEEYPFSYNIINSITGQPTKATRLQQSKYNFYFDSERFEQSQPFVSQLVDILKTISIEQLGADAKDAYAFGPRAQDIYYHVFSFFVSTIYAGNLPGVDFKYKNQPVFTFSDAITFLSNEKLREQVVRSTYFPDDNTSLKIKDYLLNYLPNVILGTQKQKAEALSAAINKLRNAVPPNMERIACNIIPKFKIGDYLQPGKIIIINVPLSIGSKDAQILLSTALLYNIHYEITKREESKRNDIYIFIDEADTISSSLLDTFVSKNRKFGAHLFINFQNLKQVPASTLDSILASVVNIFAYRSSGIDAEYLQKEFGDYLTPSDFTNLAQYYAYARVISNESLTPPFVFKAEVLNDGKDWVKTSIIERTRKAICNYKETTETSFMYIFNKVKAQSENVDVGHIVNTITESKSEEKKTKKNQGKQENTYKEMNFFNIDDDIN